MIDRSKLERLLTKMSKDFGKKGAPVKPEDIFVPWDDATDKSKGCVHKVSSLRPFGLILCHEKSYAFVEFRTADDANFALQALDGHVLDTRHTFRVNRFTDIETYADLDETYEEPEREEYKPRVRRFRPFCQCLLHIGIASRSTSGPGSGTL